MIAFDWYAVIGEKAGAICWGWVFLCGFQMCCAWAIVSVEAEHPRLAPELATLAPTADSATEADVEWTDWEALCPRRGQPQPG